MADVVRLNKPTPAPKPLIVVKLIVAISIAYFMISAWDDYLDELLRKMFGLEQDTLRDRLVRAVIATILAIIVLRLVGVHIDDLFGVLIH